MLKWLVGLNVFVAAVLCRSLGLGSFDIRVPFAYGGDGFLSVSIFKTVITDGWYLSPSHLGAPFGAKHFDYPVPDGLFLFFVKMVGYFVPDANVAFNLLYIGSFFLVASTAFYALQKLGARSLLAAIGATAYTFLPYHYIRTEHIFLACYFLLPLVILLVIRMTNFEGTVKKWLTLRKILFLFIVGSGGVYYAFFSVILFVCASAICAVQLKKWDRFKIGIAAASIVFASLLINLAPNIYFKKIYGKNSQATSREPKESEHYGFKMMQLLLPSSAFSYPIPFLGNKSAYYSRTAPLVNENGTASLGLLGALGFLFSLALILRFVSVSLDLIGEKILRLSQLSVICFFFGTIGGFGSIYAYFVSDKIRCWNRISVVLAFIAITIFILLLEKWLLRKVVLIRNEKFSRCLVSGFVIFVAIADFSMQVKVQSEADRKEFAVDRDFIQKIEALVPVNTMVLQLPHIKYPEVPPLFNEGYSGMLRGYLHSQTLKWSYGAMKGRSEDLWIRALGELAPDEQIKKARESGFGGIYVERRAFKDHGVELENQLQKILGEPAVESSHKHMVFYKITL